MRDDFTQQVKEVLAKRVGCRCSNPGCRKLTSGPHEEPMKAVNIGVAAHITAAASGGKRYDPSLSSEQRKAIENGIWLCQNCGKLIDSDEQKYPVALLLNWKRDAEIHAEAEINNSSTKTPENSLSIKFEQYLHGLIDEPQCWWLDEINQSTWYEFQLFTKTEEPTRQLGEPPNEVLKPILNAIRDSKNQKILITGEPGTGKSTLLEKIAVDAARNAQLETDALIPVLVRLKEYETSGERPGIRGLLQASLESYDPSLNAEAMNQLLQSKKVLLLIDGWNELSDEKAKSKIKSFCKPYPIIVTSRNAGDYWEIQEKFEIQPLSRTDVESFFDARLQNTERHQLQVLNDRVKDFGQTPLMVWMLYSIFKARGSTPETRSEAYYAFTKLYAERAKQEIDFAGVRSVLGKLAFHMMQSQKPNDPTDFTLDISEVSAARLLGSEVQLKKLQNHLLRWKGVRNPKISFCHQSLQEYYAAEYLRLLLQELSDEQLKRDYLNLSKWTEPIALMLALVDEKQALRLVNLAIDNVDLILGAKLAGEVSPKTQPKTINLINNLEIPLKFKLYLLGNTKSSLTIPFLEKFLDFDDTFLKIEAVRAIGKIRSINSLSPLERAMRDSDNEVRWAAANELAELNDISAIIALQEALYDEKHHTRALLSIEKLDRSQVIPLLGHVLSKGDSKARLKATASLHFLLSKNYDGIFLLLKIALHDDSAQVRRSAAHVLSNANNDEAFLILSQAWKDEDSSVRYFVCNALEEFAEKYLESSIRDALLGDEKEYQNRAIEVARIIKLDSESIIRALLHIMLHNSDWLTRNHASAALIAIGNSVVIDCLSEVLRDRNCKIAKYSSSHSAAMTILLLIHSEDSIPILEEVLLDRQRSILIRGYAIEALGKIGNPCAIQIILENVKHERFNLDDFSDDLYLEYIYLETISTLGKLGIKNIENLIIEVLRRSGSPRIRKKCAAILEIFPTEIAKAALLNYLSDEEFSVRFASALALARQKQIESIPVLINALGQRNSIGFEESIVCEEAIDALVYLNEKAISILQSVLSSNKDLQIRQKARLCLAKINNKPKQIAQEISYVDNIINQLIDRYDFTQLLEALDSCSTDNAWQFSSALDKTARPERINCLTKFIVQSSSNNVFKYVPSLIVSIQNRSGFYNYEIWQESIQNSKLENQKNEPGQTTNVFNIENFQANHSAINMGGTIHGDQTGTQHQQPEP